MLHEGTSLIGPEASPPPLPLVGFRHVMLALCFLCSCLCYADRTNLSIALVAMRRELGWDSQTAGSLLSAFFWGYLVTQVPGGIWAARYGAKCCLLTGLLLWSTLTVLTPACASSSTAALFAVRVLVGLSEGVAIPCLQALVAAWALPNERSSALAFVISGQFVGTILAYSCAGLVDEWWPSIFYLFGFLGFVWAVRTPPPAHGDLAECLARRRSRTLRGAAHREAARRRAPHVCGCDRGEPRRLRAASFGHGVVCARRRLRMASSAHGPLHTGDLRGGRQFDACREPSSKRTREARVARRRSREPNRRHAAGACDGSVRAGALVSSRLGARLRRHLCRALCEQLGKLPPPHLDAPIPWLPRLAPLCRRSALCHTL